MISRPQSLSGRTPVLDDQQCDPETVPMIERGGTWWILIAVHKTGVSPRSESSWPPRHQKSIQRI